MENDRRKGKLCNYTVGRISQWNAAQRFNVSEKTINTNLKNSNAKRHHNEKEFLKIRFNSKKEF
jgi:DNA-binding CsgD family transcriptional regulator